jgi:hypothetical protein
MNFISLLEVDEQDCWFLQDGAVAHTANLAMQILSELFCGRIISRNFWSSRSPDLSPLYFIFKVHKSNPHTLEELKQNTELCILNVTAETLHLVASNMRKRVNACIVERGGHFQLLI